MPSSSSPSAGNLQPGLAEREVEDEFIRFGTLRSVWIARKPPGFGEYQAGPPGARCAAVSLVSGAQVLGRRGCCGLGEGQAVPWLLVWLLLALGAWLPYGMY